MTDTEPQPMQPQSIEPSPTDPHPGQPGQPGQPGSQTPAPTQPPEHSPAGRVELFDGGGLDWQPVSPRLVTARTVTLLAFLVPLVVALAVGAVLLTRWLWIPAVVLVLVIVWGLWLIRRQVAAMSYVELSDDLVIRKGRLFRQVSSIPFGRLQYVDLQSGPLERKLGMATLQIFTASPSTSATVPGLPAETAERMRERLMQRGEAQRAGL